MYKQCIAINEQTYILYETKICETFQDTIVNDPLSTYPLLSVKTSKATARMDEVTTKKFFKRASSLTSIPTTLDNNNI